MIKYQQNDVTVLGSIRRSKCVERWKKKRQKRKEQYYAS